jgi:CheY-like chemotaxis protein
MPASRINADYAEFSAGKLPSSASQIREAEAFSRVPDTGFNLIPPISKQLLANERPLSILVIDDEPLYTNLIKDIIQRVEEINPFIEVMAAKDGHGGLELAESIRPDIVIVDVNLGPDSPDGFQVVRKLRQSGCTARICVHSNQDAFDSQRHSIEAGADLFLPKPVTRSHLLQMIASSLNISSESVGECEFLGKHLVVIDDDVIFLECWESYSPIKIFTFASPGEFFERIKLDPCIWTSALAIVSDYYFAGVNENGLDFARRLRQLADPRPIFLATDRPLAPGEWHGAVDGIISKDIKDGWKLIKAHVRS